MRILFVLKKIVISFEFLLILFWVAFYDLVFFSELTKIVKDNVWIILPGAIVTFATITYKLTFPEQDKKNLLKEFPDLDELELTINISIIYFIIFLIFIFSSLFTTKHNLPALGSFGMLIVISCQTLAFLSISRILRNHS